MLAVAGQSDDGLLARLGLDRSHVRRLMEGTVIPGKTATARDEERPYTSRTKKTFSIALESAQATGHVSVGVEHILLALLREGRNIGAEVLQQCGLTIEHASTCIYGREVGGEAR